MAISVSPSDLVNSGSYALLSKHNSWERVPLSQVATVQNGFAFKSEHFDREHGIPLIRIRDVSSHETEHRYTGEFDPDYLVRAGDILIGMDGDFTAARWQGEEGLLNQRVCRLLPRTQLFDEKFLFLCLQPFLNAINAETSSVTVKHLSSKSVEQIPLPLPPLSEQRRIVAKVEEVFSELTRGAESLVAAREQLELYRLVILHQATLDEEGKPFQTANLGDLIGEIGQGWSPKCDVNNPAKDGEWAIIKTTVVQPMSYHGHECKPLPSDLQPRPSLAIRDGDLLMTRKGPRNRTGVVCLVRKARPNSMLCDTVYRFRARDEVILPEYLELALNAPSVVQEINTRKSGISESGISLNHSKLRTLPIPLPKDLEVQGRIVQTVVERTSLIEHQCDQIGEQLQRIETLRRSVLKRAFTGALVAQDSKDESASALLDQIRSEQERGGTARRLTKKYTKKEAA